MAVPDKDGTCSCIIWRSRRTAIRSNIPARVLYTGQQFPDGAAFAETSNGAMMTNANVLVSGAQNDGAVHPGAPARTWKINTYSVQVHGSDACSRGRGGDFKGRARVDVLRRRQSVVH